MAGTDTRQRTKQCLVRFTEEEFADVSGKADKAGIATAAFLRAAALGNAGPRAQRRPPAEQQLLRQILGHLGKVGSNVNQIARQLNSGERAAVPELREALAAYLDLRDAIYRALNMDPSLLDRPHDH